MMNAPRLTLLGSQEARLREYLGSHDDKHERCALVLFRRLQHKFSNLSDSDRYIAVDVIPFEAHWVVESSPTHIQFELKYLRDIFRRCEEEGLVFGFVHNHPNEVPTFSEADDNNEITLLSALSNRNGRNIHFVAMLWTNGQWLARVRHATSPEIAVSARHILVIGERLTMYGYSDLDVDDDLSSRQAAAFGKPFVNMFRSLRIGVIGGGGTGSPTVTLLARAGASEIVIIDQDTLERSNLNRVRGAAMRDINKNKAEILKDFLAYLELPVKVDAIQELVDESPLAIDALSTCDVIFGCTDDQIGREVLNTILYIYALAYIDVGLGGLVTEDSSGNAQLRYHFGRISTILPEAGECLFCQDVITPTWIAHQYALRTNPDMSKEEEKQRYLEGAGDQAPGVGPFTSATADYGVAGLYDLLRPFRKFPPEIRRDMYTIDFIKMEIRSTRKKNNADCPYCQRKDYLLWKTKDRLNRPSLGKADVAL